MGRSMQHLSQRGLGWDWASHDIQLRMIVHNKVDVQVNGDSKVKQLT